MLTLPAHLARMAGRHGRHCRYCKHTRCTLTLEALGCPQSSSYDVLPTTRRPHFPATLCLRRVRLNQTRVTELEAGELQSCPVLPPAEYVGQPCFTLATTPPDRILALQKCSHILAEPRPARAESTRPHSTTAIIESTTLCTFLARPCSALVHCSSQLPRCRHNHRCPMRRVAAEARPCLHPLSRTALDSFRLLATIPPARGREVVTWSAPPYYPSLIAHGRL